MNITTKAWKDPVFRASLTEAERTALPASPVGVIELADSALDDIQGIGTGNYGTMGCCGGITARTHCSRTMCSGDCTTISYCSSYCGGSC